MQCVRMDAVDEQRRHDVSTMATNEAMVDDGDERHQRDADKLGDVIDLAHDAGGAQHRHIVSSGCVSERQGGVVII